MSARLAAGDLSLKTLLSVLAPLVHIHRGERP